MWETPSSVCEGYFRDRLNRGMPYDETRAVWQIALCDFTLFKETPEFYSTYKLLNVRTPNIVYNEKFVISNIDLTRIDLATKPDRKYKVDQWARFFKARTWEDMKMLAEKDKAIDRAVSGMWQLTEEEMIRERCRAREEWIINDSYKTKKIEQQRGEIEQQRGEIEQQRGEIEQQRGEIEQQKERIDQLQKDLKEKDLEIEGLKSEFKKLEEYVKKALPQGLSDKSP